MSASEVEGRFVSGGVGVDFEGGVECVFWVEG